MSWLSQLAYCPRRAGLLLNERLWAESTDTAKGRAEHTRVHTQRVEKRGNLVNLYEFTVFSDSLLLLGKCDCVEARRDDSGCRKIDSSTSSRAAVPEKMLSGGLGNVQ